MFHNRAVTIAKQIARPIVAVFLAALLGLAALYPVGAVDVGETVYAKNEGEELQSSPRGGKAVGTMSSGGYKVTKKSNTSLYVEGPGGAGWVQDRAVQTTRPQSVNKSSLTSTDTSSGQASAAAAVRGLYPETVERAGRKSQQAALADLKWMIEVNKR
ncbi:hypothetical protein DB346_21320 [Verrucomicrobia bacterium LW23]|nr:hypothetical protein DB346_21320 [Verrucomicrobia bacterium LW23]